MNKFTLITLFSAILAFVPDFSANAKRPDFLENVIEKIEKKYQELRKTSPFIKAKGQDIAQSIRFIQPEDNIIKDYSKLKQIALVRHGEPDLNKTGKFSWDEANTFLKCYDTVCIIVPEKPFFNLHDKEEVKVFSSPLTRAFTTAEYLCGKDKDITVSPIFKEFETALGDKSEKKEIN